MRKSRKYALRRVDGRLIGMVGSQNEVEALQKASQLPPVVCMEPAQELTPITVVAHGGGGDSHDSVLAALEYLLRLDPEREYLAELRHKLIVKYPGGSL